MPAGLPRTNHFGFRLKDTDEVRSARAALKTGVTETEWQDDVEAAAGPDILAPVSASVEADSPSVPPDVSGPGDRDTPQGRGDQYD